MAFPTLALPRLPLRLSHLPSSLVVPGPLPPFPRALVSPHRTPSSVCFLAGDNGPAGGLWNSRGTEMVLAHTRQAGAASAPIPSCPVHTGRCGHVPWGLFLLQPLQPGCHGSQGYSSGLNVRAVRPRLRKEKKAPPCTHFTEPGAPATSFRKGTRTKPSPPTLDPTQDNSMVF